MTDPKKRGLGRGLDALFRDMKKDDALKVSTPKAASADAPVKRADEMVAASKSAATLAPAAPVAKNAAPVTAAAVQPAPQPAPVAGARKLPLDKIQPGEFQPRTQFDEEALEQLAQSIAVHGIVQPLLVRPIKGGMYEIIAGERRWRAAQRAKLHELPVVVKDLTDKEALEIALIENLQRQDLTAIEEAEGYQRLMDEFQHTQEDLAKQLGKSRSHIANTLRLLKLTPAIRVQVLAGKISAGHARALLTAKDPELLMHEVIGRNLSVRDTEKLAQKVLNVKKSMKKRGFVQKDVDILALEQKITTTLGLKVTIDGDGPKGKLVIEYKSLDQLDDVVKRLVARKTA